MSTGFYGLKSETIDVRTGMSLVAQWCSAAVWPREPMDVYCELDTLSVAFYLSLSLG